MLAMLIIIITSLAIVAVGFNTYLNMLNSSNQIVRALDESRLVNDWTISIQKAMRPFGYDRRLLVPNGVSVAGKDYMLPPDSINLPSKNSWDRDLIYCPYAITKDRGADSIKAGDSETYGASLFTGVDGIEYVYSILEESDPTGTDLLAAIISPIPSETNPSCNDIRYDSEVGNYYVINYDGVVHAITYNSLVVSNQPKSIFVSSQTTLPLSSLVSDWNAMQPDLLSIELDSSVNDFATDSIDFINTQSSKAKTISIKGQELGSSTIIGSSAVLNFNNVSVKMSDINFGSGVSLNFVNSDVTLKNVTINNVTFEGVNIYATGDVQFISNNQPVSFVGSQFNGSTANLVITKKSSSIGLTTKNSKVFVNTLTINNDTENGAALIIGDASSLGITTSLSAQGVYLDSLLSVDTGGSLNLNNISIFVSTPLDTFIFNKGNMTLSNLSVSFSSSVIKGIILGLNSDTVLNSFGLATSGNLPTVGIEDIGGAKFVAGFNTLISASAACWFGDLFESVAPSSSGSTSEPLSPNFKASNRSAWTCNI